MMYVFYFFLTLAFGVSGIIWLEWNNHVGWDSTSGTDALGLCCGSALGLIILQATISTYPNASLGFSILLTVIMVILTLIAFGWLGMVVIVTQGIRDSIRSE